MTDIPAQVPPLTPGTNKKMTEALKASFASWEKEQERLGIPKGETQRENGRSSKLPPRRNNPASSKRSVLRDQCQPPLALLTRRGGPLRRGGDGPLCFICRHVGRAERGRRERNKPPSIGFCLTRTGVNRASSFAGRPLNTLRCPSRRVKWRFAGGAIMRFALLRDDAPCSPVRTVLASSSD